MRYHHFVQVLGDRLADLVDLTPIHGKCFQQDSATPDPATRILYWLQISLTAKSSAEKRVRPRHPPKIHGLHPLNFCLLIYKMYGEIVS